MSEQDRVHEASPIRLLQARQDGLVARSAELSRSLIFCVLMSSLFLFAGVFQDLIAKQLVACFTDVKLTWSNANWIQFSEKDPFAIKTLLPLIVFLSSFSVLALLIWHFQSPLSPNIRKAMPDMTRLSPAHFWQQLLSFGHWIKVFLLIIGFVTATACALSYTWSQSSTLASAAALDLDSSLGLAGSFLKNSMVAAGIIILVLGFADYIRERIRLSLKLRMTDQERREEARNSEMNPQVRQRLLG